MSVINEFPVVESMKSTIEGTSVDNYGHIFAVNKTHMMNLTDAGIPLIMTAGNLSFFAFSNNAKSWHSGRRCN